MAADMLNKIFSFVLGWLCQPLRTTRLSFTSNLRQEGEVACAFMCFPLSRTLIISATYSVRESEL
ncbi:hypothetical protein M378DRAFT_167435 [Amanita muscaria Koide BX008]|uniref:Uncharacterized protein n=1 Tax=Amanita muscaria (strain Koide BX008) TaxID=946122 RepID=A0A0C2WXH2_AMAMK|nr:hypothetical protein M378DRAFT_167435 [Amanita muscaria Koide BX008]